MEKLFTVAGTSSLEGVVKFRVANGSAAARTKVLVRSGHTEILLQDLPKGMTKEDAFAFVKANGGAVAAKAPKDKLVEAVKREGRAAPKQKTVKMATIVKKVSKKFIAAKAAAENTATAPAAPMLTAANADEIAKIKAKNLETMRRVTNKLAALRSY
jgi:hypothetical protein